MTNVPLSPEYTPAEEVANSITHGIGAILAIGGLVVLTVIASLGGDSWAVTACSIYGTTLILSFLTSTLYHSISLPRVKSVLRMLDHAAIYLLIAGTWTPFLLIRMRGSLGWTLFGLIWGVALLGILQDTLLRSGRRLSILIYLGMGWTAILAGRPLMEAIGLSGMWLLALGGMAYTVGVVFYLWRRLPYGHAIWHLFVLLGGSLHFWAVLQHVRPSAL